MIKRILLLLTVIISLSGYGQTWNGNRVTVKQGITIRTAKLDTLINDTTGISGRIKTVLTADAVYKFVTGRLSGITGTSVWGGITGTISNQTDLMQEFGTKVDTNLTITINGVTNSLAANRSWTIAQRFGYSGEDIRTTSNRNFSGANTSNLSFDSLNFIIKGVFGAGNVIPSFNGVQCFFYPRKAAFRAGTSVGGIWDDANIGNNSTALGSSTATADYSSALGQSSASNTNATAFGAASASGINATASGTATASGDNSTALGAGVASGAYSHATGQGKAQGQSSNANGTDTYAKHFAETVIGQFNDSTATAHKDSFHVDNPVFTVGIGPATTQRVNGLQGYFSGKWKFPKYGDSLFSATPTTIAGFNANGDFIEVLPSALGGGGATDLSIGTRTATDLLLNSSTGADVNLPLATNTLAGIVSAATKARIDSNQFVKPGEGIDTVWVDDSTLMIKMKYDTVAIASFGAGGGQSGDTSAFSTSTIYGSFFHDGSDTLIITKLKIGLQGTSPSITADVFWNDSLNVSAGATKLVTAGTAATNIYEGTTVTSFNNTKIPPGNWVWVKTSSVTTKPTYFTLTLVGYKKRVTP